MNKRTYTRGPWYWRTGRNKIDLIATHSGTLVVMGFTGGAQPTFSNRNGVNKGGLMKKADSLDLTENPDAKIIADAPSMDLILRTMRAGIAWFDLSNGDYVFDGIRASPPVVGDDWTSLVEIIGWKKIESKLREQERINKAPNLEGGGR